MIHAVFFSTHPIRVHKPQHLANIESRTTAVPQHILVPFAVASMPLAVPPSLLVARQKELHLEGVLLADERIFRRTNHRPGNPSADHIPHLVQIERFTCSKTGEKKTVLFFGRYIFHLPPKKTLTVCSKNIISRQHFRLLLVRRALPTQNTFRTAIEHPIRMLPLTMRQPIQFTSQPIASAPDASHKTIAQLERALLFVIAQSRGYCLPNRASLFGIRTGEHRSVGQRFQGQRSGR